MLTPQSVFGCGPLWEGCAEERWPSAEANPEGMHIESCLRATLAATQKSLFLKEADLTEHLQSATLFCSICTLLYLPSVLLIILGFCSILDTGDLLSLEFLFYIHHHYDSNNKKIKRKSESIDPF